MVANYLRKDHLGGLWACRVVYHNRLGIGLADINPALEERAIFDADARRGHVAGEGAFSTNDHAVSGGNVATDLFQHHSFAGSNACAYGAIPAPRAESYS